MKGCLGSLVLIALFAGAVWLVPKIADWRMTPEERAAQEQRLAVEAEQERLQAVARAENQQRKNAEIAALKDPFLQELVALQGLNEAVFMDNEVIRVRFAPLVHIGEDHVRVMCEGIARMWAERAGLEYVRCESWYGNKRYASGLYQGPVPKEYFARVVIQSQEQQQDKDQSALAAMKGKSLADIEGTHGTAISKNKETGWAEFKTFRAKFENGKVVEVSVKSITP